MNDKNSVAKEIVLKKFKV